MADPSQPVIKVTELEQVCIVVHDLDKSMESLSNTFGIGPWDAYIIGPDALINMTYHGKPARFSFKLARTHVGSIEIELIQSIEGDTIYRDFLRAHGEGIHHLGWHRVDTGEAFTEATQALEKAGFPCIMSGLRSHGAFAYFDTTKVLNTILEVVWRPPRSPSPSKMANLIQPVVKVTELEQVCIVVHDLDKSMESLSNTFGIGPWGIRILDSGSVSNMTYHGKPARFSFKLARTQVGSIEIELIQSIEGDTIYRDFLRAHGEGIHHLGWHRVDTGEAFTEATQALEKAGFPCIMSGVVSPGAFAYFDTTKVLNTILEVVWRPPRSLRLSRNSPE